MPKPMAIAWGPTRRLSLEHDLALYDAAYLELAIRRKQTFGVARRSVDQSRQEGGLDVLVV